MDLAPSSLGRSVHTKKPWSDISQYRSDIHMKRYDKTSSIPDALNLEAAEAFKLSSLLRFEVKLSNLFVQLVATVNINRESFK